MMNKFISFNFNSFKPIAKVKHSVKITEFADYVFDKYGEPICIGIQEVNCMRHLARNIT